MQPMQHSTEELMRGSGWGWESFNPHQALLGQRLPGEMTAAQVMSIFTVRPVFSYQLSEFIASQV